ncbi:hypothetical protein PR048_015336 [Dryococelus australis]|uniref:HAT C-terminal dimerisation domain-containing protein n=1 Tax=Dryococelus australis TaxID=614101 RepID=A0ABQ9HGX5_9NEOP|nr:hypothetical protein PR048_015336 [Dryococelus australis]
MSILKMEEESKIKDAVKDWVLLRILLASGEHKMLVAGTKVLNNANSTQWSNAVVDILLKYEVKYENVCAFVSDCQIHAKYAELLKVLLSENLLRIQCWAQKLNLVGNIWSSELAVNECVVKTKMVFNNTWKRKHRYLQHLQESNANPKLFFSSSNPIEFVVPCVSTAAKLAATGQKCFLKLSSLVGADPAKLFLENVGRLYDPRNIIAKGPEVDALDVEAQVKTLPFLQAVINASGGDVDVLAILLSLKYDFQEYPCCAMKCVWIPVANIDSERAFSQYNIMMTDKRTALKADNIEVMLGICFGAV